jgi:hypothetical protein
MKIPLNITVDVDLARWRAEFGHGDDVDIRADVRSYWLNVIQIQLDGLDLGKAATARHTKS